MLTFKRLPAVSIVAFFLVFLTSGFAKPPSLTPHDTWVKIEEILRAHVSHQKLTPEIVQRALQNFLEELDPGKTYFIASEINAWTDPSSEFLAQTLSDMKREDYSAFEAMLDGMGSAIARRALMEEQLEKETLSLKVDPQELKDVKWASSQEDLYNRLIKIRSLQVEAAMKLSADVSEQFLKRVSKRRVKREGELTPSNKTEKQQFLLSVVLKAVSSALDSQTNYFTPAEANQFMIQVQQRLFGIGAQLRDDLNGFTVIRLLEGGPALSSNKLKVGDRIIAVNHEPVVGMDIIEAVELIRGTQGSPVMLTVLRPANTETSKDEEKLDVEIIRGEVVLKETRFEKKAEAFGDGAIAYLHLFSFYQDQSSSSAEDLRAALAEIQEKTPLKGVILDLRNNAGGLLPQAVAVTGLFINKGIVVSVKDNTGLIQHLRNVGDKPAWDGPLIVLVNRLSASAAEIVAQTLQDYGRAILVGDEKTYGKGTFQTFTLETNNFGKINPKGEYKVTRGRYYTVSGKSPQLVGVQSDIVVPGPFSKMKIGEEFSKFPLGTESIPENFQDTLNDIPPFHRFQFGRAYKDHMQTVLSTYRNALPLLIKNSSERISCCLPYQKLLKDVEDEDAAFETFEAFNHNDLQLQETFNILKDLLFIQDKNIVEFQAAPAA